MSFASRVPKLLITLMWPLQHVSRIVELSFPRGTAHDVAVVTGLGIGPEKEQDAGAGIWMAPRYRPRWVLEVCRVSQDFSVLLEVVG